MPHKLIKMIIEFVSLPPPPPCLLKLIFIMECSLLWLCKHMATLVVRLPNWTLKSFGTPDIGNLVEQENLAWWVPGEFMQCFVRIKWPAWHACCWFTTSVCMQCHEWWSDVVWCGVMWFCVVCWWWCDVVLVSVCVHVYIWLYLCISFHNDIVIPIHTDVHIMYQHIMLHTRLYCIDLFWDTCKMEAAINVNHSSKYPSSQPNRND